MSDGLPVTRTAPSSARRLAIAAGWSTNAMLGLIVGVVTSWSPDPSGMAVVSSWFFVLTALSLAVVGYQLDRARRALRPEEFE